MHCALIVHLITLATMQLPASMVVMWYPVIIELGTYCGDLLSGTHRVKVEVSNNLSKNHSKTHPADVLLHNWFTGRTAALDVSITSPLHPITLLEVEGSATAATQATETRMHEFNDPKCSELGWICAPMVVETYGAWGKESIAIISSVASRHATSTWRPKSFVLNEIYGWFILNLFCANATAVLSLPP